MKDVRLRNVPDDVHDRYRRRAAAAGQSLQEHLLAILVEGARRPTVAEVLDRAARRGGGDLP